jgi:A/G-specific adenine glycosylase
VEETDIRQDFAERIVAWAKREGRHDLPWQTDKTPYRVWVSEIMLQQTQVSTVVPYYLRFMARFPSIASLADASPDEVLHLWSGLGYYSRARNLHQAAKLIVERHSGVFPVSIDEVEALPGIGRSTAGAVLSLAAGQSHPILDGNVKRVLCRHEAIGGWPGKTTVAKRLWTLAAQRTPPGDSGAYTQAIMDLGATVCTRRSPTCLLCPVAEDCAARADGRPETWPTPKPRRERPTRRSEVIIVRDSDGRVLLEQRPPVGVWASLWGFPELSANISPQMWCERELGRGPDTMSSLEPVQHGFTHFELHIVPTLAQITGDGARISNRHDRMWFSPEAPAEVGLPAPVARLLERVSQLARGEQT